MQQRVKMKRLTISMLGVLLVAISSSAAVAQVHLLLDFCRTNEPQPVVGFSFLNAANSGPAVCQITAFPATAECFPLQCVVPSTWTCFPGDVTTFFRANEESEACIAPGETLSGFELRLFGDNCCLHFAYFGPDGAFLGEEEACFDCEGVGVERRSWGSAKRLYD